VKNGVGSVSDGWSSTFSLPDEDACQDWVLLASEEVDGFTTLELRRALDTKDAQDRAIVAGPNRVIAAFGEADGITYHQNNRVGSEIVFFGTSPDPPLPSDAKWIDLLMPNYSVPDGVTHYICQAFALPVDQEYFVVQVDPIVQPENIMHVHHYLVHICPNTSMREYASPQSCSGDTSGYSCSGLLSGWASGGGSTYLPPEAGFPMGKRSDAAQYVVLELHYNNPSGMGGYVDSSGIRVWYTSTPRQYDAAMLTLGDPGINFHPIPALALTEYETECPSLCTATLPHEIRVFQSFPHMHQIGAQIWTTQWRNGTKIAEHGRVEFWSFDHQQEEILNFTIQPGDRLNTHCVYDTRHKSSPTPFGISSSEEMCMHFVTYYPRVMAPQQFLYCGFVHPNYTVCGQDILEYANPTIYDPPGGANRTFGVRSSTCQPTPGGVASSAHSVNLTGINLCLLVFLCAFLYS